MTKPSIPQGTRDFSAETIRKRNFIFQTIRGVFESYGFEPLETPAMENVETLLGKYGEEGDRLIFKILNNGLQDEKNKKNAVEGFSKVMEGKTTSLLTERALKYDLTIPFARYVAMYHHQITFPYKRYQIQPVWRADRPQKGRYREFTQCDADIVGSKSLINELDFIHLYHAVFTKLGMPEYRLKINNRKILAALADQCGGEGFLVDITIAIDKLDKIGMAKIKEELLAKGLNEEQLSIIETYLSIQGNNTDKLTSLQELLGHHDQASQGIQEMRYLLDSVSEAKVDIDFTLARGLNYYTGCIFEVKAPEQVKIGSIGGGGRYDNLTGLFGVSGIPGVGISFGVDRIYDTMEELQLFPENLQATMTALFLNMGEVESIFAYSYLQLLRKQGIACELYPDSIKMEKQFKYADKKNIHFAIIIGSKEMADNECVVKNLQTGTQEKIALEKLVSYF